MQRGVPDSGSAQPSSKHQASHHYLFIRSDKIITAYPLDLIYSFKPPAK